VGADTIITVSANTLYTGCGNPLSLADFKVGDLVTVAVAKQTDGSFIALSVNRLCPLTLACPTTGAQVGVPYSSALAAAGGVGPYAISINSGSLPGGLTLNSGTGAITGTPITALTYSFTAQVMATSGVPAGAVATSCTITVNPAPPPLTLRVTPTSLNFGAVKRFTLSVKTVTVKNTGSGVVAISKVSVTPGSGTDDFGALSLCPTSLAVGKSCTIYVSLLVDDRGPSLTGTLNIPNNATGSPQSVALSATVR
jgi:hypothetical protein